MASDFFTSAASNAVGTMMVDYLVKPLELRLRYLFRFNNIVEDIRQKKTSLTSIESQSQEEVKEAERQNQVIEKYVEDWLIEADKVLVDLPSLESRVEENKKCFNCCPNFCWRFQLSKEIDRKIEAITKLVETSKFDRLGHRAPLPGLEFFISEDVITSKSLTSALNEIMDALKVNEIKMIGVWGKRGVGKTTLVHTVGNKAKESQLFDQVVIADVSQAPDIGKIQDKIADFLDFKFEKRSNEGKAEELWVRLKNQKKILIILEDVWNEINLKDIGIPVSQDHEGCKIIFTTPNKQVCNFMECQVMVSHDGLNEKEAWNLFKMKASLDIANTSPDIIKAAMEIAKECKGLPLAIVTLAKALRGKTLNGWQLACDQLKSSRLMDIEYLQEEDRKMLNCLLN